MAAGGALSRVAGASLLSQGAEARVWELPSFLGRHAVAKQRFAKRYRLPALDAKLTARRLANEARSLAKARKVRARVCGVALTCACAL